MRKLLLLFTVFTLFSCGIDEICRDANHRGQFAGQQCYYDSILRGRETELLAYVDAFERDAERYGITQQSDPGFYDRLDVVRRTIRLNPRVNQSNSSDTYGQAIVGCGDPIIVIGVDISTSFWNADQQVGNRLAAIYHELGHAVMDMGHAGYDHIMYSGNGLVNQTPLGLVDGINFLFHDYLNGERHGGACGS